jgi:hypothetical protein
MAILIVDDFYKIIAEDELEDVVGDLTGAGWATLQDLEEDAIAEMVGYLDVRYDATKCLDSDDNTAISILKRKLIDMILYDAFALIVPNNIPDLRKERRGNAIDYLEKVADGFIKPNFPIQEEEPTTPLRYGSSVPKSENYY